MVLKQNKKSEKKRKNYTRMPRLEPHDAQVGRSAAVQEGCSAPATPTQQGTMFGAKDAAAEFRIKVSSQMSLEYADAPQGVKTTTMSCPVFARCVALAPQERQALYIYMYIYIYIFTYKFFGNIMSESYLDTGIA